MSSVASSVAAIPTGGCSSASYSTLPTQDVACAVAHASTDGLPSNYTDLMKGCCKSAPVEPFASDCGLYCLSVDQTVADLTNCFQKAGITPGFIFCNGNNTASATSKPSGTGASASGSAASSTSTKGAAAPATMPQQGLSKMVLVTVGLLFFSAATGALL